MRFSLYLRDNWPLFLCVIILAPVIHFITAQESASETIKIWVIPLTASIAGYIPRLSYRIAELKRRDDIQKARLEFYSEFRGWLSGVTSTEFFAKIGFEEPDTLVIWGQRASFLFPKSVVDGIENLKQGELYGFDSDGYCYNDRIYELFKPYLMYRE